MLNTDFELKLTTILESDTKPFKAAVAIVKHGDKWLLGLSSSSDDRQNTWCHPGGGIKNGESAIKAAERECFEETGVKVTAIGGLFEMKDWPRVAFVPCRATSDKKVKPNSEFMALGWFKDSQISKLKQLYKNAKELIRKAKKF